MGTPHNEVNEDDKIQNKEDTAYDVAPGFIISTNTINF